MEKQSRWWAGMDDYSTALLIKNDKVFNVSECCDHINFKIAFNNETKLIDKQINIFSEIYEFDCLSELLNLDKDDTLKFMMISEIKNTDGDLKTLIQSCDVSIKEFTINHNFKRQVIKPILCLSYECIDNIMVDDDVDDVVKMHYKKTEEDLNSLRINLMNAKVSDEMFKNTDKKL